MDYLDFAVSLGLLFAGGLLKLSTLAGLVQCSFRRNCDIMAALPLFVYNADLLRSLNVCSSKLRRATRKILFSFGLWRPSRQPQWISKRIPSMLRQPKSTHPNSVIRLATLNVWSLRAKYVPVADIITANDLDVLAVTEYFHSSLDYVAVQRAAPPGFSYLDRPRSDSQDAAGRGGGIVVYHKSSLSSKKIELHQTPLTFEALAVSFSSKRGPVTLLAIYRPGSAHPSSAFFEEFSALLEQFAVYDSQLVLTGDLNLHLEDPSRPGVAEFAAALSQFGLKQHVSEPTHRSGGWLDVMITRDDCQVTDVNVHPPTISDHGLVLAAIPFIPQPVLYITRQVRRWKSLDREDFAAALRDQPLFKNLEDNDARTCSELFELYETTMAEQLEKFLPVHSIRTHHCPLSPWFDAECRALRRRARCLERIYRRTQSSSDRADWIRFVRNMHSFYRTREQEY